MIYSTIQNECILLQHTVIKTSSSPMLHNDFPASYRKVAAAIAQHDGINIYNSDIIKSLMITNHFLLLLKFFLCVYYMFYYNNLYSRFSLIHLESR